MVDLPVSTDTIDKIVEGLRSHPILLLNFGLVIVVLPTFLFALAPGDSATDLQSSRYFYGTLAISLCSFVLVGLTIIRVTARPLVPSPIVGDDEEIADLGAELREIWEGVEHARESLHEVLIEELEIKIHDIKKQSKKWKSNKIQPSKSRYTHVLLEFYKKAKQDIFSTSTPDYFDTWQQALGKNILKTHSTGQASVTRVFIVENPEKIDDLFKSVLQAQLTAGNIDVRVYFESENTDDTVPAGMTKDFTIVDNGAAVGVTKSYGAGQLEAEWRCYSDTQDPEFRQLHSYSKELLARSTPANEILIGS